eukprot:EG_transcript_25612
MASLAALTSRRREALLNECLPRLRLRAGFTALRRAVQRQRACRRRLLALLQKAQLQRCFWAWRGSAAAMAAVRRSYDVADRRYCTSLLVRSFRQLWVNVAQARLTRQAQALAD